MSKIIYTHLNNQGNLLSFLAPSTDSLPGSGLDSGCATMKCWYYFPAERRIGKNKNISLNLNSTMSINNFVFNVLNVLNSSGSQSKLVSKIVWIVHVCHLELKTWYKLQASSLYDWWNELCILWCMHNNIHL